MRSEAEIRRALLYFGTCALDIEPDTAEFQGIAKIHEVLRWVLGENGDLSQTLGRIDSKLEAMMEAALRAQRQ